MACSGFSGFAADIMHPVMLSCVFLALCSFPHRNHEGKLSNSKRTRSRSAQCAPDPHRNSSQVCGHGLGNKLQEATA